LICRQNAGTVAVPDHRIPGVEAGVAAVAGAWGAQNPGEQRSPSAVDPEEPKGCTVGSD
jgi:hypothetical protein